jgi:hypothetical protein
LVLPPLLEWGYLERPEKNKEVRGRRGRRKGRKQRRLNCREKEGV